MKDFRRQSISSSKCVEIGRVDLAIQPRLQSKAQPVGFLKRAMADAMNRMAGVGQLAGQIAADETVGAGYPDGHDAALWPTNE